MHHEHRQDRDRAEPGDVPRARLHRTTTLSDARRASQAGRQPASLAARMSCLGHPGLVGLSGRPYLDFERYVDTSFFAELHEEICLALAQMPLDYTGGSHRSMGIMPKCREPEALVDYQEVIRGMS